jgi:hypothetical protein
VDLHYTYDGSLTTSTAWSGDVSGSVSWQYNNDFNKIFETVTAPSGSATTAFGYDRDQLLTCASPTTCSPPGSDALRLIRSSQHGLITGITLGSTSETLTYNSVGELATQVATFGSTPLVNITYHGAGAASRDALGRIVQKTEVIGGVTKVYRYTYDNLRRLTDVTIDGVLEEHFEYDANGNRTLGYNRTAGPVDGQQDAYRHCLASCRLVQDGWGENMAENLGNWNEDPADPACKMDLNNNDIGRRLGRDSTPCEISCRSAPLQNSP